MEKHFVDSVKVKTANVEYADGIVIVRVLPDSEVDLEEAKNTISAILKLTRGEKYLLLIDKRELKDVSPKATKYYSSKEVTQHIIANAIFVGSISTRLIANFFIRFNKPAVPVKLFTSESEALQWLKEFKK